MGIARITFALAALWGGLAVSACDKPADTRPVVAIEGMRTVFLRVEGMTCNDCEQKIIKAVQRIPGVERCMASHTDGYVTVWIDNAHIADDMLVKTVEGLGYKARLTVPGEDDEPATRQPPESGPEDKPSGDSNDKSPAAPSSDS